MLTGFLPPRSFCHFAIPEAVFSLWWDEERKQIYICASYHWFFIFNWNVKNPKLALTAYSDCLFVCLFVFNEKKMEILAGLAVPTPIRLLLHPWWESYLIIRKIKTFLKTNTVWMLIWIIYFMAADMDWWKQLTRSQVTITVELHLMMPPVCLFLVHSMNVTYFHVSLFSRPCPQRQLRAEEHLLPLSTVNVFQWCGTPSGLEHANQSCWKHKQPAAKAGTKHMHAQQSSLLSEPRAIVLDK